MGGKGKTSKKAKKLEDEEAKKREEDARRLAQKAESWLKNEEEEKKPDVEEAIRKEEDEINKTKEAEIKKKQEESEGLRLTGSQKDHQTTEQVDTQGVQDQIGQEQGQCDPDPLEPAVYSGSILGKALISEINLIPFMPTEGEEVLDFSTIFYDKENKRIVKRTEKKVDTGGQPFQIVIDKTLVHGTHKDPRLIARAGVALTLATEDNVDRLMTDLEQSREECSPAERNLKEGKG